MNEPKKRLFKKVIAVTLGAVMSLGALMLPCCVVKDELTAASAGTYEANGCTYTYGFEYDRDLTTLVINKVENYGETLEIPATIIHNGKEYTVDEIGSDFLSRDTVVKTVIFPEHLKNIGYNVLFESSVESITLPDGLERIGNYFASGCPDLKKVVYNGTSIKGSNMGSSVLNCSEGSPLYNENRAVCLGNWLLDYRPDNTVTSVKISDLGNNGTKIENMASFSTRYNSRIETLDLEGVKYIANGNFNHFEKLNAVKNDDDVIWTSDYTFQGSPWYERAMDNDLIKIGKAILYYKTDSKVLDFTSGDLAGIKCIADSALEDCKNADTICCDSDCYIGYDSLYKAHNNNISDDPLPEIPTYNIKYIYLDGKKLTYSLLIDDPNAYAWLKTNYYHIEGSAFIRPMVEEKIKALFKQMEIPYYGLDNKEFGMHTPTEEFYIRLKIHNYLSEYDYDYHNTYKGCIGAFLMGGKVDCQGYADISHFLLESAGVECKSLHWDPFDSNIPERHVWNSTRIGDEWFESDDGWNAQGRQNHSYIWFGLSSYDVYRKDHTDHDYKFAYDSWHLYPDISARTERVEAKRTIGDIDGNDMRDGNDVDLLWEYIKGESDDIDLKRADVNFDEKVDVTDAVLLDNFVFSKAIDIDNIPIDGMAPAVKVAFLNGENYKDIRYAYTDREGYIVLPAELFEVPEGKKISYDIGKAGQKVRITDPLTVVRVKWIDESEPDYSEPESSTSDVSEPDSSKQDSSESDGSSMIGNDKFKLGDVNKDRTIDIEDAVAIIQHINGLTPLTANEEPRADVSKDNNIDIDDAVMIISYINGNSTF